MENLKLKSIMTLNKDSIETLSKKISLSRVSLSKKLNYKVDWKLSEIKKISQIYNLDKDKIFEIFFENHLT